MKENVIDVLMYLLQNASVEEDTMRQDHESLKVLLQDAGFASGEIHEAFRWLDDLGTQISRQVPIKHAKKSLRHFSATEETLLDLECRNYLLGLFNSGILTANSFELVIDRLMALGTNEIDLSELEWVVLIVLSNQSDEQEAYLRLEAMTFYEPDARLN
jgi:Smg protein